MISGVGSLLALFVMHPSAFKFFGIAHYGVWFMDAFAILASNDAIRVGIDPYGPNPLDHLLRPHVYPHWWLLLGRLGLTRGDFAWLGFALGATFLISITSRLRPRSVGELLFYLGGLCSPPILLAFERANNDLVIFVVLTPLAVCLLARSILVRFLAVPLVIVAAALKTYPVVAALLLLYAISRREFWLRLALFAAAMAVLMIDLYSDWPKFGHLVPEVRGLYSFGAGDVFVLLGLAGSSAKLLGIAIGGSVFLASLKVDPFQRLSIGPEFRKLWLTFLLGAVLLCGCFFAGTSFAYRWIYALWLMPFLWYLTSSRDVSTRTKRHALALSVLLLTTLWISGGAIAVLHRFGPRFGTKAMNQWSNVTLWVVQPLYWGVFLLLLPFLAHFVRQEISRLARSNATRQSDPAIDGAGVIGS